MVERDVVGAGKVAGRVFAGGAYVDDGQLVQAGAGLVGGEGVVCHGSFLCSLCVTPSVRYPLGHPEGVWVVEPAMAAAEALKTVVNRLRRAQGQIAGVIKMIVEGEKLFLSLA